MKVLEDAGTPIPGTNACTADLYSPTRVMNHPGRGFGFSCYRGATDRLDIRTPEKLWRREGRAYVAHHAWPAPRRSQPPKRVLFQVLGSVTPVWP